MSKILHHNDDDGRCAAFLVKRYINTINPMQVLSPKDFIEYNYNTDLTKRYPEIHENETVYIVDISMCEEVLKFVNYVIDNGGKVIHIDHHDTGIKYYENHVSEIDHDCYTPFMKQGISGAMLTWIYTDIMDDANRVNPNQVKFDFDNDDYRRRCCLVNDNGEPINKDGELITTERAITPVPDVLRFIDDNDIWKHKIVETKPFVWGFKIMENKHPLSHTWVSLFDEGSPAEQAEFIQNIIDNGTIVLKYRSGTDARILSNGFYVTINGVNICCLNAIDGNSMIFQDMYDNSPAVCKYNYDGNIWWYTFYSDANKGADCAAIVQYLADTYGATYEVVSHGGHVNAAGCTFRKNVLDMFEPDKKSFVEKRKQIRIDKEVAAEQARIAAEEEKLRKDAEKLAVLKAKYAAQFEDEEDYGF